jgi:hypothetical protein
MTGTDGSGPGSRNPPQMRSTSIARMMVIPIMRIVPVTGELARSGSGSRDTLLTYITCDITFVELFILK